MTCYAKITHTTQNKNGLVMEKYVLVITRAYRLLVIIANYKLHVHKGYLSVYC